MQGQRRLVGDHASLLGPEPSCDQLLVLARREMDEPVDPALRACDAAGVDVFPEQVGGVACRRSLLRRDIAGLPGGHLKQ